MKQSFFQKIGLIAVGLAVCLVLPLLASCDTWRDGPAGTDTAQETGITREIATAGELAEKVLEDDNDKIGRFAGLIGHPFHEVMEELGDGYTVEWEENSARGGGELSPFISLIYAGENVVFTAVTDFTFITHPEMYKVVSYTDVNYEEYLPYFVVREVSFTDRFEIANGIRVGQEVDSIANKLGANTFSKDDFSYYRDTVDGEFATFYKWGTYVRDQFCMVTLRNDTLAEFVISFTLDTIKIQYDGDPTHGIEAIKEAMAYVNGCGYANFDEKMLRYEYYYYSPFFDTWAYCWQITGGDYKDCYVCAEDRAPYRVFGLDEYLGDPFIFWQDGNFVHPLQTFLGKWRKPNSNTYIDVKEIILPTCDVVFDMCKDGLLIENVNTTLKPSVQTFKDLFFSDFYVSGDIQYGNEDDYSGFFSVFGDYQPMLDGFSVSFTGNVSYTGVTGRGGAPDNELHIPYKGEYPVAGARKTLATGNLEYFGRDDKSEEATGITVTDEEKTRASKLINAYLKKTDTKGSFEFLYGYYCAFGEESYTVWKGRSGNKNCYLYVSSEHDCIIEESVAPFFCGYSKDIVYYDGNVYEKNIGLGFSDVWRSEDGSIQFVFSDPGNAGWTLCNSRAAIPSIDVELYAQIGDSLTNYYFCYNLFKGSATSQYFLAGYVNYSRVTGGATLHITNSNIKGWELGIYPLFFDNEDLGKIVYVEVGDEGGDGQQVEEAVPEQPASDTRIVIRTYSGKIIGYIIVDAEGNKTVKTFSGKILGYYKAANDVTTDFYGKILYRGDASAALLFSRDQ